MRIPVQQFEINLPFKGPALLARKRVHHKQGSGARHPYLFLYAQLNFSSIGVIKALDIFLVANLFTGLWTLFDFQVVEMVQSCPC